MSAGIYKISFIGTDKFYIGSSADFSYRESTHLRLLEKKKHPNVIMQRHYEKYGMFIFEVIEEIERWDCPVFRVLLISREQHYLDTLNPQINICKFAGSSLGRKHTKESRDKMSKAIRKNLEEKKANGIPHPLKGIPKLLCHVWKGAQTRKKNGSIAGKNNPMYGKKGKDCPNWHRKQKIKDRVIEEEDVIRVRELYEGVENRRSPYKGFTLDSLSKEIGINPKYLSEIINYQSWCHLEPTTENGWIIYNKNNK